MKKSITLFVLLLITITACRKTRWKCDEQVSYKNDIQPLFDTYCNKCHVYKDYAKAFSLASSGVLKSATIDERRMPPEGEKRLSLKERKKIFCWIESGSPDN